MQGPAEFPWETLDAIVGGASPIDVPRLHLESLQEAEAFLESYGFQWGEPAQRRELERIRARAIAFLEGEVLPDEPSLKVPAHIRVQTDVRHLLLWASRDPAEERQRWSCALLRVMHTFAHARSSLGERFGRQIRSQILGRFTPHVHRRPVGLMLGEGPEAVPLDDFEVRASKRLESVAMKLLHKVESVAAPVFDRIGVRFVTRERFDALLVIRYLRVNNIFMFANVIQARSRNTLIDIAWVKREVERLAAEVGAARTSEADALAFLRREAGKQPYPRSVVPAYNPYSSVDYRSIQFTCRQQIRIPETALAAAGWPRPAPGAPGRGARREGGGIRFFFPYEVQILDRESFEVSRAGLASHDVYKRRQREAVMRRVLGSLLPPRS